MIDKRRYTSGAMAVASLAASIAALARRAARACPSYATGSENRKTAP
jgi:hypothetical protein